MAVLVCTICFGEIVKPPELELDNDSDKNGERRKDGNGNEVKISAGRCGHFFHDRCIREWLNHLKSQGFQKECPSCRTGIAQLKTLYPVFREGSPSTSMVREATPKREPGAKRSVIPRGSIIAQKKRDLERSCFYKHFLIVLIILGMSAVIMVVHNLSTEV